MNNSASGAVIAKLRSICGKALTKDDYDAMLHRSSLTSVVGYLKGTARYGDCFSGINELQIHRGQLEVLLARDVFETYTRLCDFVPAERGGFMSFYLKKLEINLLINSVKFIEVGAFDDIVTYLPTYIADYTCFDITKLPQCRNYDDLLDLLEETPYRRLLAPILPAGFSKNERFDLSECERALRRAYIEWLLKQADKTAEGAERTELRTALLRQTDLDNLLISYRMKAYFASPPENVAQKLMPYHYRLTETELMDVLNDSKADELLLEILGKRYVKGTPIDPDNLETAIKRSSYDYFREKLRLTESGTLALYAFMQLTEIERSNVTTIFEGMHYSVPVSELEQMLIY